ncbi:NAD(P)-dependent oxidoreductase [Nocardioides sp. zg-1228]|uniref:NAD-dependent epimerase/dehydratase family protein n=1 Tax=Nocardioides sp. zg-1228 TaxID=2763008 RepID=UPI0016426E50|nr:NAD(P)-dependent oxidoreductase [Nocardioides sp. zg-1228]MBC2932445.1 NAD(P)-dependent oxidoreductase [Nocardioides sp. zg-1228]QSF57953.1 NAD(P)-dependent oxidoreductase [Nocardioides sp. zg-1228]
MSSPIVTSPVVVVTGANGFVGSHVVSALSERGATVRAVVRRVGTAPQHPGVEEHVGDFADPAFAATVVAGADALVTTVHPLGSRRDDQRRVGLDGTMAIAEAAVDAGVPLLVHVSTAGVYDRSPGMGDVDESSPLVPDDASAYGVVKRDVDAALERLGGATRVLLRPPAILGAGDTSIWNSIRPAEIRDDEAQRHGNPDQAFAWVHVTDLADLAADLATGAIATADDPEAGPVAGGCTPVNVAGGPAAYRDYLGAVTEALGLEPVWEEGPAWTGRIVSDRAQRWGWTPRIGLADALEELRQGLRG